ncbi:MAG: hypothetical protein JF614_28555 [Acidobacteria bacterium]|nr:hypothetical protein [Acidobacteriota bacterium]
MAVEVVLNIFSETPNPTWFLDETEASELRRRLANLSQPTEQKTERRLGYRGFLIRGEPAVTAGGRIRVFRGIAELPGQSFLDVDRKLERWLLASARVEIPSDLRSEILEDLKER